MTSPLLAPILFLAITVAALLVGSQLLRRLRLVVDGMPGRLLFELAAGYLLIAYALAAAGLAGHLSAPVAAGILALAALLGLPGARQLAPRVQTAVMRLLHALSEAGPRWALAAGVAILALVIFLISLGTGVLDPQAVVGAILCLLFLTGIAIWRPSFGIPWLLLAWCVITGLAALAPPAGGDYDGLAEHLAHAKVYARTGSYAPLWYDHHSHFPALTQMLFTLGMLLHGPGLAKLFHWAFGVIALGATYVIGERFVRAGSGKWAALTFASTPIIGWLMQVGYVDLTATAYGLLAVLAFLSWRQGSSTRALALSGLMVGGMMGAKMQGIALFGVLLVGAAVTVLVRRAGARRLLKAVGVLALLGAVVAAPWYVKTWVLTGNPVYPFAYSVFGGKYWGEGEARAYSYEQKTFGVGDLPSGEEYARLTGVHRMFIGPRSPRNLLLAPWNITFNPVPFSVRWREGQAALLPVLLLMWIGPMYFCGLVGLLGLHVYDSLTRSGGRSPELGTLLWLFLPLWVWWLMSMQLTRYLIPSLVLLAPAVGYVWRRLEGGIARAIPALWMACALAAVSYLAMSPLAVALGVVPQERYLRSACAVYEPSVLLNRIVPPEGKVILYGEPRGFYLDCDYLWGDPGHHRLIPYDELQTPEALVGYLRRMRVTHALINLPQTGGANAGPPVSLLYQAVDRGLARPVIDESMTRRQYVILDITSAMSDPSP